MLDMSLRGVVCVVAFILALAHFVEASAQVTVGPGDQILTLQGDAVQEFVFRMSNGARTVSLYSFTIGYNSGTAPYEPVSEPGGQVLCSTEPDLSNIRSTSVFRPERGLFRVNVGDLSFPLLPFRRDGIVARCPVRLIRREPGEFTLPCLGSSASTAEGEAVTTICLDGTLHIVESAPRNCVGDCNEDSAVSISELVRAVRISLGEIDATNCPAADVLGDGVAIDDLVRAVLESLTSCGQKPLPTPADTPTPTPTGTPIPTATETQLIALPSTSSIRPARP